MHRHLNKLSPKSQKIFTGQYQYKIWITLLSHCCRALPLRGVARVGRLLLRAEWVTRSVLSGPAPAPCPAPAPAPGHAPLLGLVADHAVTLHPPIPSCRGHTFVAS